MLVRLWPALLILAMSGCSGSDGGGDGDVLDDIPRPPSDPRITSTAPGAATPGQMYRYDIVIAGSNTPFTITSPVPLPAFLSLLDNGDGTAVLSGTPSAGDVGKFTIRIRVTGGDGDRFDQTFEITVSSIPQFTSSPVTAADPGQPYQYNITTSGDNVALNARTISVTSVLPGWLTLADNGDGTGLLSGTPAAGDSGTVDVTLRVEDEFGNTNEQSFQIAVAQDNDAPTVTIIFPPTPGQTDDSQIVLRGVAADASTITSLQINTVDAVTSDGFATWQVTVPLTSGANILTASVSDDQGNTDANAAQQAVERIASLADPGIGTGPAFTSPRDIQIQTSENRALVIDTGVGAGADRALFAVDIPTGNRTVLSGNAGFDPDMFNPLGLDDDFANDQVFVMDAADTNETLFTINLTSGARTVISNSLRGTGDNFQSPVDVLTLGDGRVIVVDGGVDSTSSTGDQLVAVDSVTGNRSPFSGTGAGAGTLFHAPQYLSPDASEANLYTTDTDLNAVFRVQVSNGDRSVISDASTGSGPLLGAPQGVDVLEGTGLLVISDSDLDQILAVEIATGNRTTLSGGGVGNGPDLPSPRSLLTDATTGLTVLVDDSVDAVIVVDNLTGERLIVSR